MQQTATRKLCETCGSSLEIDAPSGFCVACLLATALEGGAPDLSEHAPGGTRIEDYELINEVARGGMGIVYCARQRTPSRVVALKMILPSHIGSLDALARFRGETEAAASLDHEGILPIYAVGEKDGVPFYSMKFAEGGSLATRLSEFTDTPESAILVSQLARAVAHAHERGILHRDLKPGNVLFDAGGKPFVSDFGLARWLERECDLTQTLAILGTPFYMAPEQTKNAHSITAAADIYSLGAILFHLLTGRPPFRGENAMEVLRNAAERPAPRPSALNRKVPADLETICLKCLEKNPIARYSSALALADDLDRFLARRPIFARRASPVTHAARWARRNPWIAVLGAALLTLLAILSLLLRPAARDAPAPKSIAVLPFENLSEAKENSYFATGVHDEILSKLAKIADLKVISRTSANFYKSGNPRNAREIAQQLGVAYLLDGSVQRAGHDLRVNVELVDGRTDLHLWAQTYDSDVADVFAIQSEIARTIADQLRAKISPAERAAIAEAPTSDLVANDLYLQAKGLAKDITTSEGKDNLLEATRLLEEAVARDSRFVRAYCKLSVLHIGFYEAGYDHTPARREMANAAIEKAARIQPDAGEVHLARAQYLYYGFPGYDERVRTELDIARRTLPNDPTVSLWSALIDRRQGRWAEAISNFERALELDPRNRDNHMTAGNTYNGLHRYSDARSLFERAVSLYPHDYFLRIVRAYQPMDELADIRPLRRELDGILTEKPKAAPDLSADLLLCAMLERDSAAAHRAVALMPPEQMDANTNTKFMFPREWFAGLAARTFNDPPAARGAFTAARRIAERIVRDQPDYAEAWSLLGRIDAALGRKEEAIKEGRRACELMPISKDAWHAPYCIKNLASIYAWTGERDLAFEQLAHLAPKGLHYGELKLDPQWDALRADPRFEKLIASFAPK